MNEYAYTVKETQAQTFRSAFKVLIIKQIFRNKMIKSKQIEGYQIKRY